MEPTSLNLDRLDAAQVIVPIVPRVNLVLIGCGGTGSWLAPSVARFARLLTEKFSKEVNVLFVDPDVVEPKNTYRQNFCMGEVGQNKAVTLARRFSLAWGVNIQASAELYNYQSVYVLDGNRYDNLTILIGCVDDSLDGRRAIRDSIQHLGGTIFWLDCGNTKECGQVLLGRNDPGEKVKTFPMEKKCAWLPYPSLQHSNLISKTKPKKKETKAGMSCAEITMQDEQGLTINQTLAAVASDYLKRLLLTGDLDHFQTYVDLNSGSMQSTYITAEALKKWRRRKNG